MDYSPIQDPVAHHISTETTLRRLHEVNKAFKERVPHWLDTPIPRSECLGFGVPNAKWPALMRQQLLNMVRTRKADIHVKSACADLFNEYKDVLAKVFSRLTKVRLWTSGDVLTEDALTTLMTCFRDSQELTELWVYSMVSVDDQLRILSAYPLKDKITKVEMTTTTTTDYDAVFEKYKSSVGDLYPNVGRVQIYGQAGSIDYMHPNAVAYRKSMKPSTDERSITVWVEGAWKKLKLARKDKILVWPKRAILYLAQLQDGPPFLYVQNKTDAVKSRLWSKWSFYLVSTPDDVTRTLATSQDKLAFFLNFELAGVRGQIETTNVDALLQTLRLLRPTMKPISSLVLTTLWEWHDQGDSRVLRQSVEDPTLRNPAVSLGCQKKWERSRILQTR